MKEKLETIFSNNGIIDSKKKLNRSNKVVPQKVIDAIEGGITSEELDKFKKDFPIFFYQTQLTVHGVFPEMSDFYLFNYKSVFQNKNMSIGVRFNCVDEVKRREISKRLKTVGISYHRDSTKLYFYKDFSESELEEAKTLYNKIDENLFYGGKYLQKYQIYGRIVYSVELYVNAIFQENVDILCNSVGATKEMLLTAQEEAERKEAERKKERELEEAKREASLELDKINKKDDLNKLSKYPIPTELTEGFYIKPHVNSYARKIVFSCRCVYKIDRKVKLRFETKDFDTLGEALKWQPRKSDYSATILRVSKNKMYYKIS